MVNHCLVKDRYQRLARFCMIHRTWRLLIQMLKWYMSNGEDLKLLVCKAGHVNGVWDMWMKYIVTRTSYYIEIVLEMKGIKQNNDGNRNMKRGCQNTFKWWAGIFDLVIRPPENCAGESWNLSFVSMKFAPQTSKLSMIMRLLFLMSSNTTSWIFVCECHCWPSKCTWRSSTDFLSV